MDERWLLDMLVPPPTAAEIVAFGERTRRDGACVLWTGSVRPDGYGQASFRGETYIAHRLAFLLVHGGLPTPKWQVAHRCDRKLCVSPKHWLVSTRTENNDDHWRLREERHGSLPPLDLERRARRGEDPRRSRDAHA